MIRALSRALGVASVAVAFGCMSSAVETETTPQDSKSPGRGDAQVIDHVAPRRDFTGPAPTRFEWTAAQGADEYAIGLWNESDTLVWRQAGLHELSVRFPGEIELEPGTYYWSVTGLRDGRPIASSGLSAFVVMPQKGLSR